MAETQTKRQREEEEEEEETNNENFEETKRHKSYNQILSILDEDPVETTEDLSSFFSTLQQELSSDFDPLMVPNSDSVPAPQPQITGSSLTSDFSKVDEDEEKERVIRHLLEASDDELGIPHRGDDGGDDYEINGSDVAVSFTDDGLWEFEDEAANYYTLLQSELFR